MKMFSSGIKALAIIAIGCYLGYGAYYMVVQRKILYPGAALPPTDVTVGFKDLKKLWLKTSFGEVEAWFLPAFVGQDETAPALIFFHGNGEVIDYWPSTFADARQIGLGVLLVEYPGYGRSGGKPNKTSINETVLAAYDALIKQPGVDPARIVVYGRSLGGGAACLLLGQRDVAAVILQSAFTDTSRLARQFYLPGFLVLDKFNNLLNLSEYPGPVLVFHSQRDDTVPYSHAQDLVDVANKGELIHMDCVHSDCPPNFADFWLLVENFLKKNEILTRE